MKQVDEISNKIKIAPVTNLKEKFEQKISLTELDEMIEFCASIIKEWRDTFSSIRIGEDSFSLTTDTNVIKKLIAELGGIKSVDYLFVSLQDKFSINVDLSRNKITMRTIDRIIMERLVRLYQQHKKNEIIFDDILIISLIRDAKEFLLNKVQQNGVIYENHNTALSLTKSYILTALQNVDLGNIVSTFVMNVIHKQKLNGRWTDELKNSPLLITANIVIVISKSQFNESTKRKALEKGIKFIMSKMNKKGCWHSKHVDDFLLTALCYLAIKTQRDEKISPTTITYLKDNLEKNYRTLDPILLEMLTMNLFDDIDARKWHYDKILKDFEYERLDVYETNRLILFLFCAIKLANLKLVKQLVISLVKKKSSTYDHNNYLDSESKFSTTLIMLYVLHTLIEKPIQSDLATSIINSSNRLAKHILEEEFKVKENKS